MNALSYLAGIFDGEGCVQGRIQTRTLPSGTVIQTPTLNLAVSMTYEPTILMLHEVYGGKLVKSCRPTKSNKRVYRWAIGIQSPTFRFCLESLLRYAPEDSEKRLQVVAALEYLDADRDRRMVLAQHIIDLKTSTYQYYTQE